MVKRICFEPWSVNLFYTIYFSLNKKQNILFFSHTFGNPRPFLSHFDYIISHLSSAYDVTFKKPMMGKLSTNNRATLHSNFSDPHP